ncbi:MAG TPA: DUF1957 domain-containing protein [Verrucomicrobiales bacterium]|nr:DUF1957 domain-containing protein [Verrucomicrobiales bacterium]
MQGHLAIILHAHLPFVRHPQHEKFLEESWLFEAITESYLPLVQSFDGWSRDGMDWRLTLTLSPTLCAMLKDPLLQDRYNRHLNGLIELAEKEIHRTHWDRAHRELAWMYHHRFTRFRDTWRECGHDLVSALGRFQDEGRLEIITTAATHALLPLVNHGPSVRAQIMVAREHYRECFGRDPRGIWIPECAYADGIEAVLQEAGIRWFTVDTHGLLHAHPRPRYGVFAPLYLPNGVAAFGRDLESARQVWSRNEGYPGDSRYRDFYRDIGFDLDWDYVRPYVPSPDQRGFTGIKYHRITSWQGPKEAYDRNQALWLAAEHAQHFLDARVNQVRHLNGIMDRPPLLVCPYDAELFGHWWYEGPEFLNFFMRKAYYDQQVIKLTTPTEYLEGNPTQQVARPSASSWGEEGYYRVWLNEKNEWIYPHLQVAQERMTALANDFPAPNPLQLRALKQAARELLLAQSSDWPFILRTGTNPDYVRRRVKEHLLRFISLHEQLRALSIDEAWLSQVEAVDNLFDNLNFSHWAEGGRT